MTKKEVVFALRKAFNIWASLLPDIDYKYASRFCNDSASVNNLHVLELAAEEEEEEGGEK